MIRRTLGLLAGLTLLFAAGWWFLYEAEVKPAADGTAQVAAPIAHAVDGDVLAQPSRRGAADGDARSAALGVERAPAQRAIDRERDLHGVVLDPEDRALAGASVAVLFNEFCSQPILDLEHRWERSTVAETTTDARGEFAVSLPRGRPYDLEVRASGFADARVEHCAAGERVVVRMERGAQLFGRVLRREDQSPVAGAEVRAQPRSELAGSVRGPRVSTDRQGRFVIAGLLAGTYWLKVQPEREAAPGWEEIELHPGETLERDVLIDAGATLRGRVTDALTGLPIAGAEVSQGWTFEKVVETDADGEYLFGGFPLEGYFDIAVRAAGYGRTERNVREPGGEFIERLDVALVPARSARGRVVDASGAPLAGAYVSAAASDFDASPLRIDWCGMRSRDDGTFELADLRADVRHALYARKPGFATVVLEFPASESESARIELGDVRLPAAAFLCGEIVDEQGRGIAQQNVTLRGTNADRGRWNPERLQFLDSYVAERETRTDDLGRFAFGDLAAGTYVVEASRKGSRDPARLEVDVAEGQFVTGARVVLPRGLAIGGRVLGPNGESVHGFVSIDPVLEGSTSADVRTDESGQFLAQGLAPGEYALTVWPDSWFDPEEDGPHFAQTVMSAVAAGTLDAVIVARRALRLAGQVRTSEGAPVAGATVYAMLDEHAVLKNARTGADGRFELWLPEGELFDLVAEAPADLPAESAGAKREARASSVGAGGGEVTLTLP